MTALLFDFGGTLDGDGTPWLDRFYDLYKEEGVDPGRERFARAFYDADDRLASRHKLPGKGLEETVALQARDVCASLAADRPELAEKIAGRFISDCRKAFSRNKPVLERLARKHKLGIVSNFYGNLDSVLASEDLASYFGVVADSAVLGSIKPEPKIFQHALEALRTDAKEALMIGDSIPRDMRGAEGLGLRHALIASGGTTCCPQALVAASLPALEPLL